MRRCLLILFSVAAINSVGQKTIDVTKNDVSALSSNLFTVVGGTPFVNAKYARVVSGSPFFSEDWQKGSVIMNGGKEYAGLSLKLDLLNNELHYLDQAGAEMVATSEIQKVILFEEITQRVFSFVNSSFINSENTASKKQWCLVLSEGNTPLFKNFNKTIREDKPYNSATIEQHIDTSPRYFILYKNSFIEIKKIKDAPDILADKKEQLVKFIKDNNLKNKTDDALSALINFYNSL
jgi:hypothetical protein